MISIKLPARLPTLFFRLVKHDRNLLVDSDFRTYSAIIFFRCFEYVILIYSSNHVSGSSEPSKSTRRVESHAIMLLHASPQVLGILRGWYLRHPFFFFFESRRRESLTYTREEHPSYVCSVNFASVSEQGVSRSLSRSPSARS